MPANNILCLDVGEKRVGVALVRSAVRIPVMLQTLERQADDFWQQLTSLIKEYEVNDLVLGLPRGLEGQETGQTKYVRTFAEELTGYTALPIYWQDEALTSVKATSILDSSGKPYTKGDVDAMAASLILADYLETERHEP